MLFVRKTNPSPLSLVLWWYCGWAPLNLKKCRSLGQHVGDWILYSFKNGFLVSSTMGFAGSRWGWWFAMVGVPLSFFLSCGTYEGAYWVWVRMDTSGLAFAGFYRAYNSIQDTIYFLLIIFILSLWIFPIIIRNLNQQHTKFTKLLLTWTYSTVSARSAYIWGAA